MNNKIAITLLLATMTGVMYSVPKTVQELQNEEQQLYDTLTEYWIDKEGSTHLGNKELDPKAIQFSFSKNIMEKQKIDQIIASMNTPIKRFTAGQQEDFKETVKPHLDDLAKVRTELQKLHDQLDSAVKLLAEYWNKNSEQVMQMSDTNLSNLGPNNPDQAKKIAFNSDARRGEALKTIKTLRPAFNIQTVAAPSIQRTTFAGEEHDEQTGAGQTQKPSKVSTAAAVVNESQTKLSNIIKAASEAAIYAPCGDLHFDIIEDEEGIKFLRLIK